MWKISGFCAFYSGLLGATVSILPYFVFARRVFRYRGAYYAKKIISDIYSGVLIKWVMTIVGFSFIFLMVKPVNPISVFSLFIVGQLLIWFTPILMKWHNPSINNCHMSTKCKAL
ncbi:MAG: F0F1 ATP synthase subunit I [Endozoicomonadaceae bacterium]|nr:F0F1 ATP synthase subunit I [Endozoicomonadaceae bacterium]